MFGFNVRNKWHWFAAAGICFFLAWAIASMPTEGKRATALKPVTTKVVLVGKPTVFPTRTPTAIPTATAQPLVEVVDEPALCPAGQPVPSGAPMWVTVNGTSFSQSGIYKFEATGQNAGTLTGREETGLCETSVQGGFGAVWYNPTGGK